MIAHIDDIKTEHVKAELDNLLINQHTTSQRYDDGFMMFIRFDCRDFSKSEDFCKHLSSENIVNATSFWDKLDGALLTRSPEGLQNLKPPISEERTLAHRRETIRLDNGALALFFMENPAQSVNDWNLYIIIPLVRKYDARFIPK